MKLPTTALTFVALTSLVACRSASSGRIERIEPRGGVSLEDAADDLAGADVVFLGELHDNDVGHELQLAMTQALSERREVLVVSMEQFEADVQVFLDAYLAGNLDEAVFLAHSRPWPNYVEHYRPVVEWAKLEGVPVVAANIPRPLARRVAYQGLGTTDASLWSPWAVHTDEPPYLSRFMVAMGGSAHEEASDSLKRWFAAQCIKDDMMAQSIVQAIEHAEAAGTSRPLVVHWCGRFHSDYDLGTVSRVALRRPDLDLRVVSMTTGRVEAVADDGAVIGDYVLQVP